jgi:hypothetical protein
MHKVVKRWLGFRFIFRLAKIDGSGRTAPGRREEELTALAHNPIPDMGGRLRAEHLPRRRLVRNTFFGRRMRLPFFASARRANCRSSREVNRDSGTRRTACNVVFVTIWRNKTKKKLFRPQILGHLPRFCGAMWRNICKAQIDCCPGKRRAMRCHGGEC